MLVVAKVATSLLQPLAIVAVLIALGVVMQFYRPIWGRRFCALALFILLAMGWTPLADLALRPLEQRFAVPTGELNRFAGIVVLGGAILPDDGRGHGELLLGRSGERITEPVKLLRKFPRFRMVFSGGDASLGASGEAEADLAELYFRAVGLESGRAMYERASRNTFENATMTKRLLGDDVKLPWLLVTSAAHMPRAYATFAKAGWNVTPYPVDFETSSVSHWADFSLLEGAEMWRIALREYFGYGTYMIAGRI